MTRSQRLFAAVLSAVALGLPTTSLASDVCLQYSGEVCDLAGDAGFFRFLGAKLPSSPKKAVALHGRVCGSGVATGTAVQDSSGGQIHLLAYFECLGDPGVISATLEVGAEVGTVGSGGASLGNLNLNTFCTVTVVDCAGEPATPL